MISVLMSVYNEKICWIEEAIQSILKQTYKNIEFIIVIDNPFLDEEIKTYLEKIKNKDKRIRLIWNEKNIGLAESLNRGLKYAKGEYIARMDADDISLENRLEMQMNFLQDNKHDMVATNKINIDEEGNVISKDPPIVKNPNKMLKYGNMIVHSSVLVKTNVIKALNGYRGFINSEDYDLWLRLNECGYSIGIMNEALLLYRIRQNSASVERELEQYYVMQYILELKKERQKTGKDSFSKCEMDLFLKKKRITPKKKNNFSKARKNIEIALDKKRHEKKLECIGYVLRASFLSPLYVMKVIYDYLCVMIIAKKSSNNM